MLKQTILYVMIFCMMIPQIVYAKEQSNTQIEILTDHSRQIVFEQINGEEIYSSTIDKKGYQNLSYNEPGTYEYRIYESKDSQNRDATEYIATVCVLVDEATGELQTPVVAIDYADASGKPKEVRFGKNITPSSSQSTSKPSSTTSSSRKTIPTKTTKTSENNTINSKIPFVKTGDTSLFMLYIGLFVLSMMGFIFATRRKNNEDI